MKKFLTTLAVLTVITTPAAAQSFVAAATAAHAGELALYGGESIELGSIRGVAYYVESASGDFRVVTILADSEAGLPVRFEATLADKQRLTISVPGKLGAKSKALEISRTGDRLILTRPQAREESLVGLAPSE
jgi:hypothetical protein